MMHDAASGESTWRKAAIVIAIILAVAFLLRIWGVWFGLPYLFHNDEGNEVLRALQLGTGQFNFRRIDKGLYFYLLFVEYGVLFVVLKAFGVVSSSSEFGELFIRDPSIFYLIGRSTTAIIGTATVFMLYLLGRRSYSQPAALIAAGGLAVNLLHADLSHYVVVDIPLTLCVVAALYFAVRMIETGDRRDYWLAALMAACATAAKTPGVLLLISLLTAHYFTVRQHGEGKWRFWRSVPMWQAAGVFALAYIVLNPGIVVHFDNAISRYFSTFLGDDPGRRYLVDNVLDDRSMFANTNLYLYYLRVTMESMTWPVFIICGAGTVAAMVRRRPVDIVLLAFVVPTFVFLGSSNDPFQFFPRYILPAIPVLLLFGARLATDVLERVPPGTARVAAILGVVALAVLPATRIVQADIKMTRTDTRALAAAWVEANIEPGSRIFIEGTRTEPIQGTVPLRNSPENLRDAIERYADVEPGKARYFRMALAVQQGPSYDLLTARPVQLQALEAYKGLGVQYFVLRPENYEGSRVRFHWPELVAALRADPGVTLMRRFDNDGGKRPGPVIEIYRVDANVDAH